VQIVGDGLVLFQGFLPAVSVDAHQLSMNALGPTSEVVDLAPDLLLPGPAGVRRQGVVGGTVSSAGRPLYGNVISE
jgi:hypothetical protein